MPEFAASVVTGFYQYSSWAFCTPDYPEVAEAIFDVTWYTMAAQATQEEEDEQDS